MTPPPVAHRPYGDLGDPARETVAGWIAAPHGAFARHVRATTDPLWGLAAVSPDLAAEIDASGWVPRAAVLLAAVKELLDLPPEDPSSEARRSRAKEDAALISAVRDLFVMWQDQGLDEDEVPDPTEDPY